MRKLYFLPFLLLLIAALTPLPLHAGNGGFSWNAVPYYDGIVRGPYAPIKVTVSAGDSSFTGKILYTFSDEQGDTTYEKPVSVDAGSTGTFVFYIPTGAASGRGIADKKVTILLSHGGKADSREIRLRAGGIAGSLGAVMGYSPTSLGLPPVNQWSVWWTNLKPEDFPREIQGLTPLRVLISPVSAIGKLDEAQKDVLLLWVHSGGALVLAGDPSGFSSLPEELRPVSGGKVEKGMGRLPVEGMGLKDAGNSPDFEHYLVGLAPDATVLLADDKGSPWIVERPVGWGSVTFLAFDPGNPPLSSWKGAPDFWRVIGDEVGANETSPIEIRNPHPMVLSRISGGAVPSLTLLFLIFFVYLLVVGPGNYLVLKKIARLEYAWLTIPIITVIFTGGVYFAGKAQRSNTVHLSQYSVVLASPGSGRGLTSGGMAIYGSVPINVTLKMPIHQMVYPSNLQSGGKVRFSSLFSEGKTPTLDVSSDKPWGVTTFGFDGVAEAPGVKVSDVEIDGNLPKWRIENTGDTKLESPVLLVGSEAFLYGDLGGGSAATLSSPVRSAWLENTLEDLFMSKTMGGPKNQALWNVAKAEMVSNLLFGGIAPKYPRPGGKPIPPGTRHRSFVIVWSRRPVPKVSTGGAKVEYRSVAAVVVPVRLKHDGKPVRVLTNDNFQISSTAPAQQGECGPPGSSAYYMGKGAWSVQWDYKSRDTWRPFRMKWHVVGVNFFVPPGVPGAGRMAAYRNSVKLFLYNFETGKMEQMPMGEHGDVEVKDPSPYWNNGAMKVALQGNDQWPGGCTGVEVELLEVAP